MWLSISTDLYDLSHAVGSVAAYYLCTIVNGCVMNLQYESLNLELYCIIMKCKENNYMLVYMYICIYRVYYTLQK
jgi:hypothetical protein